jgi:membrane protein
LPIAHAERAHAPSVALSPVRFFRRVATRLNNIGWFRAAGSLSFVTLLGLVPLATVAFAFVAQFPVFQDFLKVLETFLLRHLLPSSASAIVHEYVVVLAEGAANVIGPSIIFVAVTGVLMVDTIESEINEIWEIRVKRPIGRRILVYLVGITAGPVMIGAAISLFRWTLTEVVSAVALQPVFTDTVWRFVPTTLVVIGLVLLYRVAPARRVHWRYAVASGLLAGIALEATKRIFTWYLTNFPSYELLYGALAAFPALLFWIFLCWLIVLAGAAVSATLAEAGDERRKAAAV